MNIVVAMKQIPDLQQIRIRNKKPLLEDVPQTFGNIDRNALEAAVLIKEEVGGSVTVVAVGKEGLEDTVKEALAAGADQAYLIIHDEREGFESSINARLIAEAIKQLGSVDLVLFGEGSGDNYSSQVGSRVAELLDLPQVGYVERIELAEGKVLVTRSLEDGQEVLEVTLPAVLTVVADLNQPRIPSVTQILKAGKKPKKTVSPQELAGVLPPPKINTISNLAPEIERKKIRVKSVAELVEKLRAEGLLGRA
ncbi:electron transfer flavoprotein subunit beta/FixA family protein [Syntrophothermus lipocalidus]|uniref:Electron transfer flavoprotein alpha/beta-subunit n=1 Tax=Syntrophothermus lipocalidus (strain DSM 12680 / TGB-C1) TaxID=643648 RepID=D7CKK8_SYNLT|nr:electron transfer flavoprotein subunit beta/FixA family protein [Syntrophothermus lipocalidus]ADI01243.1 Electron transfer flavoprotein alpha/beta-subunit [Syntrophothermus lipocalidus DSM 12680]